MAETSNGVGGGLSAWSDVGRATAIFQELRRGVQRGRSVQGAGDVSAKRCFLSGTLGKSEGRHALPPGDPKRAQGSRARRVCVCIAPPAIAARPILPMKMHAPIRFRLGCALGGMLLISR